MFFLNLGYRWNLADADEVENVILLPSGISRERIERSPRKRFQRVLFDPQLYLRTLDVNKCTKPCARLGGYSWFGATGLPTFDAETMKPRKWEEMMREGILEHWPGDAADDQHIEFACYSCIELQVDLACSYILLPTPLIDDRTDEGSELGEWLDAGLEAAVELETGQSLIATIAIAASEITEKATDLADFLDTIVDQVVARDKIDGVYIVVVQTHAGHPFDIPENVSRAYMYLSQQFSESYESVILNFADILGVACCGLGASDSATAGSQALRSISFESFEDAGGGLPLPRLYSHRCATEFRSEKDLDTIIKSKLLRRVSDQTKYSDPLLKILREGGSASSVPKWVESRNNVTAAQQHFIARISDELSHFAGMTSDEKSDRARDWVEEAEANQMYLQQRMEETVGKQAPVTTWLNLFDSLIESI